VTGHFSRPGLTTTIATRTEKPVTTTNQKEVLKTIRLIIGEIRKAQASRSGALDL
jgi:hypothetical protein